MHAQRADSEIPLQTFAAPFLGLHRELCNSAYLIANSYIFFPPNLHELWKEAFMTFQ